MMNIFKKLVFALVSMLLIAYLALTGYAYRPAPEGVPATQLATTEDEFVEIDGLQIRYRSYGDFIESKPTLIFIHGFANNLHSFRDLAPLLAEDSYVIAVDLPGYGLSSKPADYDYRNQHQAKVLIQLVEALNINNPIYAGHSMGGAIALQASILDKSTRAMILIGPGILGTAVPKVSQFALFPLPRLFARQFGDRSWRSKFLQNSYQNTSIITEAVIDNLMLASKTDDYLEGMTSLMNQFEPNTELELLPQVNIPVLSIWGEFDRNHEPDEPARLQQALPGSLLTIIRDAGHYAHEEKPQEAALSIKDALSKWNFL